MRVVWVCMWMLGAVAPTWALDVPRLERRVTDVAGVLGPDANRLEEKLRAYEQATGHQFAVLTVDSLQGEVLEQYTLKVAESWRLGDSKRSDGLLVLLAMKDHQVRIEVGYGLEGAVTDVQSARVIRDVMVPRLREGQPVVAVEAGLDALMALAQGESTGAAPFGKRSPGGALGSAGGVLLMLLAIGLYFLGWRTRALLGGVAGAVWGMLAFHGVAALLLGLVLGALLGVVLPFMRAFVGMGGGRSSSGGFSGGGGSFGGGGASGRW